MRIWKWIIVGAVLTAVAGGYWWQQSRSVESALLAEAPYRSLKDQEAADYARVLAIYREYRSGKRSRENFIAESIALYSQAATRRLASSSQESLLALMHDMLGTAKKLHASSPEACFRYFNPEVAGSADISRVLTATEQTRTLELMSEVLRSAAEHPAARPTQQEVQDTLADIINATYEQFGADAQMAAHVDDPRIDRGRVCEITIALYERILALPPDTAAKLLRYMAPADDAVGAG